MNHVVRTKVGLDKSTASELKRRGRQVVSKIRSTLLDYDFTLFVDEIMGEFRYDEEDLSEDLSRILEISLGSQRAKEITHSMRQGVSNSTRKTTSRSLLQQTR